MGTIRNTDPYDDLRAVFDARNAAGAEYYAAVEEFRTVLRALDLTRKELSTILGVSENTARTNISAARGARRPPRRKPRPDSG